MLRSSQHPGNGVGSKNKMKALPVAGGQRLSSHPFSPERTGSLTPDVPHSTSASASARSSFEKQQGKDPRSSAFASPSNNGNDPRKTIIQSFLPRVSVFASPDTEELVRLKGIYGGLCGLLRPFGERIHGNVIIRDSVGSSKSWDDYGVHFVPFGTDFQQQPWGTTSAGSESQLHGRAQGGEWSQVLRPSQVKTSDATQLVIDSVVEHHLDKDKNSHIDVRQNAGGLYDGQDITPSYYARYLRKLLAGRYMVPHETFTHPVACVIAISSQSASPIETLRDLYNETRFESRNIPPWVGNEFLRYYLLVHDEDHDDIMSSTSLFNQMKRHFGLHCHLLRVRSVECGATNEDGTQLPICQWQSAEAELFDIKQKEQEQSVSDYQQYLYDTDAAVIRTFVREMVTQSIVPFMEGRVTTWNDQVASRRRGLSGRFMSLSKKWTGFGSARGIKSSPVSGSSNGNYNSSVGFYTPDAPEAVMHRLADYAFMLRDWKLSSTIYDILRADFGDDKAWSHHAIANEMTAVSLLLATHSANARLKIEAVDQMLDSASYSYISRCSRPQSTIRCLVLAVELYRSRGGTAIEEAAKWAKRLLDLSILSPLAQRIMTERLTVCFSSQQGVGQAEWCSRKRKAALWSLLATDAWLLLGRSVQAENRLQDASRLYGISDRNPSMRPFLGMQEYWDQSQAAVANQLQAAGHAASTQWNNGGTETIDEEHEDLHDQAYLTKSKQRLSIGLQPPQSEVGELFQRLHDPLDKIDDGFT